MSNYNPIYRKFINDRNTVSANNMTRGKFYLIKEYEYVDGDKGTFAETTAPIIFTLFVSKAKDIVHCVKVSGVNPNVIKRFFGKFVNEETEKLQMKGNAKDIYSKIVSKIPAISNDAYRTYKMSGLRKIIELNMDVNEITPKNKNVVGIDIKSQKRNV
jgi:hypothetical protein